jgi:hypothetical protein
VIRNNLLALAIHGAIVLLLGFSANLLWQVTSAIAHFLLGLVSVAAYLGAGYLLRAQSSQYRNLLSVSAPVALLLAALAVLPFSPPLNPDGWNLSGLIYLIVNPFFASLFDPFWSDSTVTPVSKNLLAALLSLMPTLFLWTGLQIRSWREARKARLGANQ